MKLTTFLALSAFFSAVLGGRVSLSGGTSTGSKIRNKLGRGAPAPAHVAAPAPAPDQYYADPATQYAPARPPAPVPSYESPASASYTAPAHAPAPSGYIGAPSTASTEHVAPVEKCWTETKHCCYKEEQDGYECVDDYATKQARCHPKIIYKRKCDKAETGNKPKNKPEDRVEYSDTKTVHYDDRYGPHVDGYPAGGKSDTYSTTDLPEKPYGVTAEPYDASASYAPAAEPTSADNEYAQQGSGHDSQTSSGGDNGYVAPNDGDGYNSQPESGDNASYEPSNTSGGNGGYDGQATPGNDDGYVSAPAPASASSYDGQASSGGDAPYKPLNTSDSSGEYDEQTSSGSGDGYVPPSYDSAPASAPAPSYDSQTSSGGDEWGGPSYERVAIRG